MDLGLKGQVAMVAAGSKGIGRAVVNLLVEEGAQVSVCSRNPVEISGAMSFPADVSRPDDLERWHRETVRALGPVTILVTNTGGPPAGPIGAMTDDQWQSGIDSTLMNVIRLVRLVTPGMMEAGYGRIVHITSLVAAEPNPLLPISSTLRAGLQATTKLQSEELGPHGITVNAVLPGHTLTVRQRHLAEITAGKQGITPDEALANTAAKTAIRRIADPVEIAAPVVFLCSAAASYITGTSVLVDGGANRGI